MVLIMAYGESSILFLIFTLLTIRHISYIFKITHTCIFMVLLVVLLWKNALKKKNSFSWYPNTSKKLKVIWIYFFDPYSPLLMEDVHMTPYLEPLCTVRNSICSRHSDIRIVVVFPCSMALATTMTSPTLKLPESSTNWQDQRRLAFCESPLTMVCIHTDHWHDITDTLTKWHKIVSNEVLS